MPGSSGGLNLSSFGRVIFFFSLLLLYIAFRSCASNIPPPPSFTSTPMGPPQPTSTSTPSSIFTPVASGPVVINITTPDLKVTPGVFRDPETGNLNTLNTNLLTLPVCSKDKHISVWVPGYYVGARQCSGTPTSYDIALTPVDETDNPYSPANPASNCQLCHKGSSTHLNEYPDWSIDGHSKALTHSYFQTTYLGTNVNGQQSQQIKWDILPDGQKIYPILDLTLPNYGPSYQLDYPVNNGNCVFCHAPAAFPGTRQEMDLSQLIRNPTEGHPSATEGVTCDVCHKVTDVLVGKNQLPYDDRPGVLSMSILRPVSAQEFNSGPLAYQSTFDTNATRTCYPIFSESKFCAACHYGKFANTLIYGSYQEWLNSSYSKPENFRSCQDCHMLGVDHIGGTSASQRAACSTTNQQFDFSHNMMRYGEDEDNRSRQIPLLVQKAAQVSLESFSDAGQLRIRVTVQNTGAGHKFPTDSPLRHLILLVEATDWRGTKLTQSDGPMIPIWAAPDLGGLPGQVYANILKDKDTNMAPTFSYWNPVEAAWQGADTRLVPGIPVQSVYSFAAPYDRWAKITAKLIYRKAFMNVVRQKGWPLGDLDIVAAEACIGVGTVPEGWDCRTAQP